MNRSALLLTFLVAGPAQAYVILESKYRVEVSPGVFEDQLVLKCDDGRKLTVPWEARLSEACGEVDIPRSQAASKPQNAAQERQKEIVMSRMREQYGEVDERHIEFDSGLGGAEPHFSPQMREILKKYEVCRKNTKGNPSCAVERDAAVAALSKRPTAGVDRADPQTAPKAKPVRKARQAAAKPAQAEPMPPTEGAAAAVAEPRPIAPKADEMSAAPSPDRTAREQKIAEDYAWCMRAKPKFECESQRAGALRALDAPAKPRAKTKAAKSPNIASY